jgi:hypothetical protein
MMESRRGGKDQRQDFFAEDFESKRTWIYEPLSHANMAKQKFWPLKFEGRPEANAELMNMSMHNSRTISSLDQ